MYVSLQIGNDPAVWFFDSAGYDAVAAGLERPGVPLVVEVVTPLAGRLIVHPHAAGTVALTLPVETVGWNPSGALLPRSPLLYVPSPTGPTPAAHGHFLAGGYELAALEHDVIDAMTNLAMLTVTLEASPPGRKLLALSGATLAFAVLCPAASRGPAA